jgi:hypothetical protein
MTIHYLELLYTTILTNIYMRKRPTSEKRKEAAGGAGDGGGRKRSTA